MNRSFWVAAVLAVGIVAAVAMYAENVIDDVKGREERLAAEFAERAEQLRALDKTFPWTPRKTLDPQRMKPYLAVRKQIAARLKQKLDETTSDNYWHGRRTRNDLLLWLTSELMLNRMSLQEYRFVSHRWHALLAIGERLGLLGAWQRVVVTKEHPKGLPLPPPAKDATEEEKALLRQHEKELEATLEADLLGPLLEEVAGDGQTPSGDR